MKCLAMDELYDAYPINVAVAVLGNKQDADDLTARGIWNALATLSDREQEVLDMRFRQGLTLEQCGKEHGITRERIRQIEAKALRKLRHPTRVHLMKSVPLTEWNRLQAEKQDVEREFIAYRRVVEEFVAALPGEAGTPTMPEQAALDKPLEELELSVRAYNCLRRAGVDTLGDIASKTEAELKQVRNLGRKSLEEVQSKLMEYGIEMKEEVTP